MNILDQIIEVKKTEVKAEKGQRSVSELKSTALFSRPVNSLVSSLSQSSSGIIAEYKRASPSKGIINDKAVIEEVVQAYSRHGAAGISVLTDVQFFKGSLSDLTRARKSSASIPILRKDFIIDEHQILEARASGADVILLIAACLSPSQVVDLGGFAKSLGLEVLLEIHNEEELEHVCAEVDLVGVNNRDLKTFSVDIERSVHLSAMIPGNKHKISESGISDVANIQYLRSYGFDGFLIGENFMKQEDPTIAFARFVEELNTTKTIQQKL